MSASGPSGPLIYSVVALAIILDLHNISALIVDIFLPIIFSICFGCSKEPSHRDVSFEYPLQMFWLRNKKNIVLVCPLN